MNKKVDFLNHIICLCRSYGLCIVSSDPFEGIDIADYDNENEDMYEGLSMELTFHREDNNG